MKEGQVAPAEVEETGKSESFRCSSVGGGGADTRVAAASRVTPRDCGSWRGGEGEREGEGGAGVPQYAKPAGGGREPLVAPRGRRIGGLGSGSDSRFEQMDFYSCQCCIFHHIFQILSQHLLLSLPCTESSMYVHLTG